ncbi:hypothetical protein PybrP1_012961 [[Pythium] brassicae (nom. inval.)]|nr:hypothetical protein PybrP1_012961 [[Pythium] brassicae (nom. inval.)]
MSAAEQDDDLDEQYAFVPEHLRHHFRVDFFGGGDDEQNAIRCARRARSAHFVSTALSADEPPVSKTALATAARQSPLSPPAERQLYSLSIERSITSRMTFDRSLARLQDYFDDKSGRLEQLDKAQPAAVPPWLDDASVKLPTLLQAQRQVVQAVESCLGDSDVYLAMLEPLPSLPPTPRLRVAACSSKGSAACAAIEHITQSRVESVVAPTASFPLLGSNGSSSFGVLAVDSSRKARRLLPESMTVGELSEFLVRKHLKDAARELQRRQVNGRQFLALTESDVHHTPAFSGLLVATRKRLLQLVHALKRGETIHLARPPHYFFDDPDAMAFLRGVTHAAGVFLDGYRRVHWHRVLADVTRDAECTMLDVYGTLLRGVAQSVDAVERVVIWRIARQPHVKVDVVASTQVQDDRLGPFVQWSDRLIKRIALYKVGSAVDAGRLVQGAVTRIILSNQEASSSAADSAFECEAAQYHVAWADRTVERYSWRQLRQLLPVREMNAKHFHAVDVARLTNPHGVALVIEDAHCPASAQYVLEVDFPGDFEVPQPTAAFLQRTVGVAAKSIACVRGRDARRLRRQESAVRVAREFRSMVLTPSPDALRALSDVVARVFAEVVSNLPGVEAQLAELQPGGAQLHYTFAANGSTLLGSVLQRGQGVSFQCLDAKTPLVVHSGSELRSRLRRLGRDCEPAAAEFPYVFLPLVHDGCAVGVFSANRFVDVAKGRPDEAHPEAGVLPYLQSVVQPLATAIYLKRRSHALSEMQQLALEPLCSPRQLLFAACQAVKYVLVGAWKVRVVEVDTLCGRTSAIYELSEAELALASSLDVRFVEAVRLRKRELLRDTVTQHFALDSAVVAQLYARIASYDAADEDDAKLLETLDEGVSKRSTSTSSVPESERRRLENKAVASRYLQLLPPPPQAALKAQGNLSSEKYARHALAVLLGGKTSHVAQIPSLALGHSSVYLTIASLPQFHAACDLDYVTRVAETASTLLENLRQRVERSRRRVAAIDAFQAACDQEVAALTAKLSTATSEQPQHHNACRRPAHALAASDERDIEGVVGLQGRLLSLIQDVLFKTNVYIGLLEPSLKRIQFTSASPGSVMKGKHLKHGDGVGFHVLETGAPVVVTASDVSSRQPTPGLRLRFFTTDPTTRKWPFICVPIGSVGVLSVDDLKQYERLACEPQPELGVVDFLCQLGARFGAAVGTVRAVTRAARQALRAQALTRIMAACDDMRTRSSGLLQHLVVQEVESALNGVDAYIGAVEPLCALVRFTAASSRSCMANQTLSSADSASFRVFATQRPLVVPQLRDYCAHETASTIASNGKLRVFGERPPPTGAFVCVPIPFVGVLSVDTFPGAAGGAYMAHVPEKGVVEFLSRVANLLGENLRTHAALTAARAVPALFQGNRSTLPATLLAVLHQVALNLVAAEEMHVVRFDPRTRQAMSPPLASLMSSTLDGTNGTLASLMERALQRVEGLQSASDVAAASCSALPGTPEVIVAALNATRDVEDDAGSALPTLLVVRRVAGAAWEYDVDFLTLLVPLVNDLIAQVNARVEGIVARRQALQHIERLSEQLACVPSAAATSQLPDAMKSALDRIADGLSGGDVYVGEREVGGERLTFAYASRASLMEGVSVQLRDDASSLVTVQCLERKQPSVVHLHDKRDERLLRSLTAKTCVRAHVVVPMGDDRVLCADSFGAEAFHPTTRRLEADVVQFLHTCAQALNEMALTVRYRRSYDELVGLRAVRHPNFRRFFATLLEVVRRDLVDVHSQQVMTLASDFTGSYHTEAWHAAPTRRPLAGGDQHLCYQSRCEQRLIPLGIHHEVGVQLPMTNLPRTLDQSRSRREPAEGVEKRGAFACACLATMLDAHMAAPCVALCVYTHDATSARASAPLAFTASQRQYFFALAAVAADVFTHVYRSCALFSLPTEMLFYLRERLGATDGLAVRVQDADSADEQRGPGACVVLCSSQEAKHSKASLLRGPLAAKVFQFSRSDTDVAIFARKKADPPSQTFAAGGSATLQTPVAVSRTQAKAATPTSFFKRPANIFRSRNPTPSAEARASTTAQQHQSHAGSAPGSATPSHESSAVRVKYHVLLRGVSLAGASEVLSFAIEHRGTDGAAAIKKVAKRVRASAQELVTAFLKQSPRGDEDVLSPTLGRDAGSSAYGVSTGAGFYLLAQLQQARLAFRQEALHLETDIRGFLTGVQPTARGAILTGRTGVSATIPSAPAQSPALSVFTDGTGEHGATPAITQAAMVLLEASMLLVGFKRDTLSKMDRRSLLKEFLRASVAKRLAESNPRDRKQWGAMLRAGTTLQQAQDRGLLLQHTSSHDGAGASVPQRKPTADIGALPALQAMLTLHAALVAVVRFQKQLESDAARDRLRVDRTATTLQCFYRVARAKAALRQRREAFAAARTIQCAFRQHLARRRALFLRWTRAATRLQRAYRLKLLRRKGSRSKRLSDELLAVSKQFGGLAPALTGARHHQLGDSDSDDTGGWRADMDTFDTFGAYIASRAGKEQLKREESVMTRRMHAVAKAREQLPAEERIVEDVKDLFELMDTEGAGELSRAATRELMARLRVPLTSAELDDVVDMMDSDRSGAVSLAEFLSWFFHEYAVLKKRSRDCGVVARKDWQWVIQNSARAALRKRFRAVRVGRSREAGAGAAQDKVDAVVASAAGDDQTGRQS